MKTFLTVLIALFLSTQIISQPYKKCLVTDFEHWGMPGGILYGVPDYFSRNPTWVTDLKRQTEGLLVRKFGVKDVKFLSHNIRIKNDLEPDRHYFLDEVDRSKADLFVSISSYVSAYQVISIGLEVQNQKGKKLFKRKSKLRFIPREAPEGLSLAVDLSKDDFQSFYEELLQALTGLPTEIAYFFAYCSLEGSKPGYLGSKKGHLLP